MENANSNQLPLFFDIRSDKQLGSFGGGRNQAFKGRSEIDVALSMPFDPNLDLELSFFSWRAWVVLGARIRLRRGKSSNGITGRPGSTLRADDHDAAIRRGDGVASANLTKVT